MKTIKVSPEKDTICINIEDPYNWVYLELTDSEAQELIDLLTEALKKNLHSED